MQANWEKWGRSGSNTFFYSHIRTRIRLNFIEKEFLRLALQNGVHSIVAGKYLVLTAVAVFSTEDDSQCCEFSSYQKIRFSAARLQVFQDTVEHLYIRKLTPVMF